MNSIKFIVETNTSKRAALGGAYSELNRAITT
jgi:hypothetical protein